MFTRYLCMFAAVLAMTCSAQTLAGVPDQLEKYMQTQTELGHISGTVLVAKDGKVLLEHAYGKADFAKGTDATVGTRYRIASLTKQFSAMGILILANRGKLGLDDPISKHLPDTPAAWSKVTIRNLLNHTSGIPDYESALELGSKAYGDFMSLPDAPSRIVKEAREKPLDFEPGTKFNYSNTGYVILGFLIEHVAGTSLEGFLHDNIFVPLGMDSTGMDREGLVIPERANGYSFTKEPDRKAYYGGLDLPASVVPAQPMRMCPPQADAGMYSTAGDLFKWEQALNTEKLVPKALIDEMFTPGQFEYGFGWFIPPGGRHRLAEHNGELPGFHSIIRRYPDDHVTIIILTNVDLFYGRIADDLASLCFAEPINWPERQKFTDVPAGAVLPLVGRYRDANGRTLEVSSGPDGLTLSEKGRFNALMLTKTDSTFFAPMFNCEVRFEKDPAGKPTSVLLKVKGVDWRAKRLEP